MGTLFVIATPIGNRGDLSPRARETLATCQLIAAEDTRHTGQLLAAEGIRVKQISFNEHNLSARLPTILEALASGDVGLVSDAGTPTISDPGYQLVDAAHVAGFPVRAVPGPSSVVAALSVAGFPATPFLFAGYVPRTRGGISSFLEQWRMLGMTVVAFESPNRIIKTLAQFAAEAPDASIAICRELTKLFEQVARGTASELVAAMNRGEIPAKGEFVLVLAPAAVQAGSNTEELLQRALDDGLSPSEAAKRTARETGEARSDLYRKALLLKNPDA